MPSPPAMSQCARCNRAPNVHHLCYARAAPNDGEGYTRKCRICFDAEILECALCRREITRGNITAHVRVCVALDAARNEEIRPIRPSQPLPTFPTPRTTVTAVPPSPPKEAHPDAAARALAKAKATLQENDTSQPQGAGGIVPHRGGPKCCVKGCDAVHLVKGLCTQHKKGKSKPHPAAQRHRTTGFWAMPKPTGPKPTARKEGKRSEKGTSNADQTSLPDEGDSTLHPNPRVLSLRSRTQRVGAVHTEQMRKEIATALRERGVVTRGSLSVANPHGVHGHLRVAQVQHIVSGISRTKTTTPKTPKRKVVGDQSGGTRSKPRTTPTKPSTPSTGALALDVSSLEVHGAGAESVEEAKLQLERVMESTAKWREEHVAKLATHLADIIRRKG